MIDFTQYNIIFDYSFNGLSIGFVDVWEPLKIDTISEFCLMPMIAVMANLPFAIPTDILIHGGRPTH